MADPQPSPLIRLPLTDAHPEGELPRSTTLTAETIARVVDEFYTACRADPLLGPVFNAHVQDWDGEGGHLARIRAFWGSALLRTGGYSGRPLEAHLAIPGLSAAHFAVWLRLFKQTVERCCTPADAALFMTMAGRMANRILDAGAARRPPGAGGVDGAGGAG